MEQLHPGAASDPVFVVEASVVASEPDGAYQRIRLAAPQIATAARPGQFVAVAVGGVTDSHLLRRAFSIRAVDPQAGWVELVVARKGEGTQWIVSRPSRAVLDVIGPLGHPFPDPEPGSGVLLVGGGYGAAPLGWFADVAHEAACRVGMVLGAASADRLHGVRTAEVIADGLWVTTDDGSAGLAGVVTDVLPEAIASVHASTVYAVGPMGMLRAVTEVAAAAGARAYVSVEEAMACGVGVCMTCVLPVVGPDGVTRMVRSCLDGPTFDGQRVRWDAFAAGVCAVPDDAWGAPAGGGH